MADPSDHLSPGSMPVGDERERLRAELADARARVAAVADRASAREAAAREAMRVELLRARAALNELEQDHAVRVAAAREEAAREVERILGAAWAEADAAGVSRTWEATHGDGR